MKPLDYAAIYAAFDAITKERALTPEEQARLDQVTRAEYHLRYRRERQIAQLRARINGFLADLSPAKQLQDARAEALRAAERLRDMEDWLEPGSRLARIEGELGIEPVEPSSSEVAPPPRAEPIARAA